MPDVLSRLTGALSDRYVLERELGRGGMATVYLATDLRHGRKVALKALHTELAASVGHERFLREIAIVAGLTHPRILTLIDSGEADGLLFYVMPCVEGETLADRLEREGALPVEEALRIAREVADALAYAHEKGVVHRDIKPSNILFEAGHAVIADFGVARALGAAGEGGATATGLAVGTPKYMSPEQAAGDEVDGRSDVYALGCVLWEMLTGEAPFTGPTPQAILARKMSGETPSLRTRRRSVPAGVEAVVATAMAALPADRYASARALERALAAPEAAIRRRPRRRAQGRRTRALAGAALAVLAAVAAWWLFVRGTPAGAAALPSVAVLPLENLTGDPEQDYFASGLHSEMIGQLGQIGGLRVISRRSVSQYANSELSVPEIAAALGVDYVVEASAGRVGDDVRLEVRLFDALPEERQLWTSAFDNALGELPRVQGEVALAVARALDVEVAPGVHARLTGSRPMSPETYEAYLRGMHELNQGTLADFEKGIRYLTSAVERDPGDAAAWAGLATGYITLGHGPAPPEDVWERARAAADRALRLDPDLAEAHAASAHIMTYAEWDWAGAEREFQLANALNPSLAMNHYHHAWYLALFARWDEAVEEHELAQKLDPLSPMQTAWLARLYGNAGRLDEALSEVRKAQVQWPDNPLVMLVLGNVHVDRGELEEAIRAHERAAALAPIWTGQLGETYAAAGRTDDARRILDELERQPLDGWGALYRARIAAKLGDADKAFEYLAFEPPHAWLPWTLKYRFPDDLREDPRWAEMMRRVNLPVAE